MKLLHIKTNWSINGHVKAPAIPRYIAWLRNIAILRPRAILMALAFNGVCIIEKHSSIMAPWCINGPCIINENRNIKIHLHIKAPWSINGHIKAIATIREIDWFRSNTILSHSAVLMAHAFNGTGIIKGHSSTNPPWYINGPCIINGNRIIIKQLHINAHWSINGQIRALAIPRAIACCLALLCLALHWLALQFGNIVKLHEECWGNIACCR